MLVDTHPVFKKEALTMDIERQSQLSTTGIQDWSLNSSLSLYHEEQAINFSGPDKMNTINADVKIYQVGSPSASFMDLRPTGQSKSKMTLLPSPPVRPGEEPERPQQ